MRDDVVELAGDARPLLRDGGTRPFLALAFELDRMAPQLLRVLLARAEQHARGERQRRDDRDEEHVRGADPPRVSRDDHDPEQDARDTDRERPPRSGTVPAAQNASTTATSTTSDSVASWATNDSSAIAPSIASAATEGSARCSRKGSVQASGNT